MNKIGKSIANLWPAVRISFVLALITASVLLVADLLGYAPDQTQMELKQRKQISESFAIQFSTLASVEKSKTIRKILSQIVSRNDDLLSAGFRDKAGRLLFEVGPHQQQWNDYQSDKSTTTHVLVPMYKGKTTFGTIELRFKPLNYEDGLNIFNHSIYKLVLFVLVFGFFGFLVFILRTLRQIDPSSVVPERVNAAFDTLSEGVLILDHKEQIVLANTNFSVMLDRTTDSLLGVKVSELNWKMRDDDAGEILYPWLLTLESGESILGEVLVLSTQDNTDRTLVVNCAPIRDVQGKQQGVLLTFDDVTELEVQKDQLQVMVSDLEVSQKEVQRQNKELHFLATRDPLTGSLNRRSFNELFAEHFTKARKNQEELCCIMVDIDHFKRVNDNYGHAVGDDVIKLLADILESSTRDVDVVGRYGGEEFCIVLPGLTIEDAVLVAERMRLRIKDESEKTFTSGPRVTASLGVSSILDHARDPAHLNDLADQALYTAKQTGRNRVIKWTPDSEKQTELQTPPEELHQEITDQTLSPENSVFVNEIDRLKVQIKQLENTATNFSEQLHKEQNYDNLTGLPNETLFYDRLLQAIDRSSRHGQLSAVLAVDINLFSQVNKIYGRAKADEMFKQLSDRLSHILRKTDTVTVFSFEPNDLTISRLAGDQFGVLITDLEDRLAVTWVVQRIFEEMSSPIEIEGQQIFISSKIGISVYPDDASTADDLLDHSNAAKHFAKKQQGQHQFQFYNHQMQQNSIKQIKLEIEMRRAIKNEEWLLYYQPKMDIATGKIKGVEALIRWNHPKRGVLSPYEFIDFAEKRGFILDIGEWVIREACRQAKVWKDAGYDIKVAVNLSVIQLRQKNFANQVLDILKEAELPPKNLELEVTETLLMDNIETAVSTLNRLHCRGIHISIDDFGTGYSSLSYLKQLPINTLKIDRAFIIDIVTDNYDKNIVRTVISMAHGMDLQVVAEGVETVEQFNLLRDMSCDEIQGYLLAKPVVASEIPDLLQQSGKCMALNLRSEDSIISES